MSSNQLPKDPATNDSHELSAATALGAPTWVLGVVAVVALLALAIAVFSWYQVAVTNRLEFSQSLSTLNRVSDE